MARSNRRRKLKVSLKILSSLFFFFLLFSCKSSDKRSGFSSENHPNKGISIFGQTQGTTYAVLCNDKIKLDRNEIDSLLANFDNALSTYIPNSIVSKFNNAPSGSFLYKDKHGYFNKCFSLSQQVFANTNGAFDPSVFQLLELWGFLKNKSDIPDSISVQKTLRVTGFKSNYHYIFKPNTVDTLFSKLTKRTGEFKIVFNAIAQGQAVDVICDYLEYKGARNYFVEIGGEVRVRGANDQGNKWSIGIDKPIENSTANNRQIINIIELDNKAVATSGNYRQFYEKEGIKYSHTIDPKTGFPVTHQLLSATVVTSSCALADAYATAFMVMGTNESIEFVDSNPELDLEILLIYTANGILETFATEGFKDIIKS